MRRRRGVHIFPGLQAILSSEILGMSMIWVLFRAYTGIPLTADKISYDIGHLGNGYLGKCRITSSTHVLGHGTSIATTCE